MTNSKIYGNFTKLEPIAKGLSEDKKYFMTTADGTKYILRTSPLSQYETKKTLFTMMKQIAALDIPMCLPIEFGICGDGVYSIQWWAEGEDLKM